MLRKWLCVSCSVVLGFWFCSALAWNSTGHKIIAYIAYENLTPQTRQWVNQLTPKISYAKRPVSRFLYIATWPDILRYQGDARFNQWHFINYPIVRDGVKPPRLPKKNLIWAIHHNTQILQSSQASSLQQVRALAFVVHLVGDAFQPLHCATLYSRRFPSGDRGGNFYKVRYRDVKSLHQFWDEGAFWYQDKSVKKLAWQLMDRYPRSAFLPKLQSVGPSQWAQWSRQIARQQVYQAPYNGPLNPAYVKMSQRLVQRQLALSGYALADWLNQLNSRKEGLT